jgi:ATP-dependent Lhr-like helicase
VGADVGVVDDTVLASALWDLVWSGLLTNDTLAPLRTLLGTGRTSHRAARRGPPRGRYGGARPALPSRTGPPTTAGRWSLLPPREADATRRAHAYAEALLDRHGVVTRGAVVAERVSGGFAAVYRVLSAFEETGRCRRGYFVEGLGAAQFAVPGAVDRMRALAAAAERRESGTAGPAWASQTPSGWEPASPPERSAADGPAAVVLAATDPANPYGGALAWPARAGETAAGHKPGRKAGALVVLVDGECVLYVERGGRTLLTWVDDDAGADPRLQAAVDALALAVRDGALGPPHGGACRRRRRPHVVAGPRARGGRLLGDAAGASTARLSRARRGVRRRGT